MFWPGMSKQIEEMVTKCPTCLEIQNKPRQIAYFRLIRLLRQRRGKIYPAARHKDVRSTTIYTHVLSRV